jgi:hypothetical protein
MKEENTLKIKELTTHASRLEKIATGDVTAQYSKREGPRRVMRGDNVAIKTMHEKVGVEEWDEGLSDDEEEAMGDDDTAETWKEKVLLKEKVLQDKARLKSKFNLKEDKQGRYRQVLHTRRPKDIQRTTKRLVTSFKVFDRDE